MLIFQTTRGFISADLGVGPYCNAIILNTIAQQELFTMERGDTFQSFQLK